MSDEFSKVSSAHLLELLRNNFRREFTESDAEMFYAKVSEQAFTVTRQVMRDISYYSSTNYRDVIEKNLASLGNIFFDDLDYTPDLPLLLYKSDRDASKSAIDLGFHLLLYIKNYVKNRMSDVTAEKDLVELHRDSIFYLSRKIILDLMEKKKLHVLIDGLSPATLMTTLLGYVRAMEVSSANTNL